MSEPKKPKIVCLCGSSRFITHFAIMAWKIEKQGSICLGLHLLPDWYTEAKDHLAEVEGVSEIMDELHLRKIDLADEVLILNVGGYIGESTTREVKYALAHGKSVNWLEPDKKPEWVAHELYTRINPEPNAVEILTHDLLLLFIAEWIAIDHGETKLQASKYKDEAQEFYDYLSILGFRSIRENQPALPENLREKLSIELCRIVHKDTCGRRQEICEHCTVETTYRVSAIHILSLIQPVIDRLTSHCQELELIRAESVSPDEARGAIQEAVEKEREILLYRIKNCLKLTPDYLPELLDKLRDEPITEW